jgi:hypothetical protein
MTVGPQADEPAAEEAAAPESQAENDPTADEPFDAFSLHTVRKRGRLRVFLGLDAAQAQGGQ